MSGAAPRPPLPDVGARLELTVGPVAHGGHCVARTADGIVVFVRHAIPGERVTASVTGHGKGGRFVNADAIEVLEPSPDRIDAPCRWSGPGLCGGCDWQHVNLAAQRRLKTSVVREAMSRFGGIDLPDDFAVLGAPGEDTSERPGLGWRTRVTFAVERAEGGRAGLRRSSSREIVEIGRCEIAVEEINDLAVPEGTWSRDRVLAVKPSTGPAFVVEADSPQTVRERVGELDFEVAAEGFWQVHPAAAQTLVATVKDYLNPQPGEALLDLYSGVGLFGLSLAAELSGGSVTLIEGDRRAAELAAANAERVAEIRDGWVALRALAGNVSHLGEKRGAGMLRTLSADLVVLDPPRTGAGRGVVAAVATLKPRAIAYVACDPVALARDVAYFRAQGYRLERLAGWDLFPQTHHVECVALLVEAEVSA